MNNNYIYHHGIKGMKWGIRRYQRKDGTLTSAGKNRYNKNYTEKQRKNDRTFYGKGSEKRSIRSLGTAIAIGSAFVLEDLALNDGRRTQLVINTSKKAARLGEQFVRRYL